MAQVDVHDPAAIPETLDSSMIVKKEGLRFVFQGYAIWLEAEQFPSSAPTNLLSERSRDNDLDQAIRVASQELDVHPIPAPHLTALYGINHLPEHEVQQRFRDLANELQDWDQSPMLEPDGFLSDIEIEGVNGGEMNMAWIEATFKTSPEHERIMDEIFQCFYKGTNKVRSGTWHPHVSFAYDNEDCPISKEYLRTLVERFPTLAFPRKVQSISLWDLNGTIDQWTLLDRVPLNLQSSSIVSDEESG